MPPSSCQRVSGIRSFTSGNRTPAPKTADEAEKVSADIRIRAAGSRVHQQCEAADDRTIAKHPTFLGEELCAPHVTRDDAERGKTRPSTAPIAR